MRLQLIIDLIMHGTHLTSIELSSVSIFQLVGKTKPKKKKKGYKNGHNFLAKKISCVVCIRIYITMFSAFIKTNSKPLNIQNGLCLKGQRNKKYKSHFLR